MQKHGMVLTATRAPTAVVEIYGPACGWRTAAAQRGEISACAYRPLAPVGPVGTTAEAVRAGCHEAAMVPARSRTTRYGHATDGRLSLPELGSLAREGRLLRRKVIRARSARGQCCEMSGVRIQSVVGNGSYRRKLCTLAPGMRYLLYRPRS